MSACLKRVARVVLGPFVLPVGFCWGGLTSSPPPPLASGCRGSSFSRCFPFCFFQHGQTAHGDQARRHEARLRAADQEVPKLKLGSRAFRAHAQYEGGGVAHLFSRKPPILSPQNPPESPRIPHIDTYNTSATARFGIPLSPRTKTRRFLPGCVRGVYYKRWNRGGQSLGGFFSSLCRGLHRPSRI